MNKTYKQIDHKQHHVLIDKGISLYMPSLYEIDGKFDGQILPGLVTIGIGVSLLFSKMLLLLKEEDS